MIQVINSIQMQSIIKILKTISVWAFIRNAYFLQN